MKKFMIAFTVAALFLTSHSAFAAGPGGEIPEFKEANRAPYPSFLFDKTPDIVSVVQTPARPLANQNVKITAVVKRDVNRASLPVKTVSLFYSSNDGASWEKIEMLRSDTDGDLYLAYLPTFPSGTKVTYYVQAIDSSGSMTSEVPGMASMDGDNIKNLVGVTDVDEDDQTVPADIDVQRLEAGYDESNIYVRLVVEGKPGKGEINGRGMYVYLMPVLNLDIHGGGLASLFDVPILAYAPILSSYLGVEPQGLFRLSELLATKKSIPGSDVKLKKGAHELLLRFKRVALGESKSGRFEIAALTSAIKNMDGLLPWEAAPFLTIYLRNHEYTVASTAPEPVAFKAGVAQIDITPPVGTPLSGYGDRKGEPSKGVHDPLMAQALVLDAGGEKIVFITADFFYNRRNFYKTVARMIEEETGIPRDHVMISASHSHSSSGGMFPELALLGGAVSPGLLEAVEKKFVKVTVDANKKLQPAKVGVGMGEAPELTQNRREGGGSDSSAPTDPELRVLRVDDLKGKPIAVLYNFSAHPTVLGGSNRLFSAEFPGATRKEVDKLFPGAIALFANSCLGNSGPNCPGDCGGGFKTIEKQGSLFADHIKQIMNGIKTSEKAPFSFISQEIMILPDLDMWTTMNALRIGDAAFVTAPGEPYVEIGFPVKAASKDMGLPITFILGNTNDGVGYIIPKEWYDKHVYEALFSMFGSTEGEFVRDQMIRLVKQLK
ncbi:MAG TPA: neutral/alkaline non-lysosomal ceramidase N-terminal domain-containing protein [bacterium]|nr:neutral/alkaline non-lysosomal ceramidase N-terminal domain-containing protein [bacterium]